MTNSVSSVFKFDRFRLDPAIHELWHGEDEVPLPPKAFGCLVYLVENRDRAVGRDELVSAVWGKTELANSVLGQAIIDIRRALKEAGGRQEYIKTVRGFGYRWAVQVEVEPADSQAAGVATEHDHRSRPRVAIPYLAMAGVILILVAAGFWQYQERDGSEEAIAWQGDEVGIALLLPVVIEADDQHRWARFGAMELIADRLRAAGQPMVPGETVIALVRDLPADPSPEDLDSLISATGARLVLEARAVPVIDGWRVSVRSLNQVLAPPMVIVEADDIVDAARMAADRLILSLGMTPPPEPESESGLALLLQQIEAARLAQQMELARHRIESAAPDLRVHPEVRFQQARIDFLSNDLESARVAFEHLLEDVPLEHDPLLHARILNDLGGAHMGQGDYADAEAVLRKAERLLETNDAPGILGLNQNYLGAVALVQGDFQPALEYLARARKAFEATGDARGLAMLDNNIGVLEALHDRHAAARPHFERAADTRALLNNIGEELRARANLIHAQLDTLDPQAAFEIEPRLNELISRTNNPEIVANGYLARVYLLLANGRLQAARDALNDTLAVLEEHEGLFHERIAALTWYAEQLERDGELQRAALLASEVVDQAFDADSFLLGGNLGRAWLLVLRIRLSENDFQAAEEIAAAMEVWAAESVTPAPKVHAALANAMLAVAQGQAPAVVLAFESALELVDPAQAPRRFLQVAEPYVEWLVGTASGTEAGPERALVIADRMARFAEQDYRAALLQLRVYHAMGPSAAWQAALDRAMALAGEHKIPPELLVFSGNPTDSLSKSD